MATATSQPRETVEGGFSRIRAGCAQVLGFFDTILAARDCSARAQRLMAQSDDGLARRGLKREEVVHYAFRGTMGR